MYSFTLALTSVQDEVVDKATPLPLYPQGRPGAQCIDGWVVPWAGLEGCGNFRRHQGSIAGPSSP